MVATMKWSEVAPGLAQFRNYERAWLRGDILAGVTVAAYLVPQVMAYARSPACRRWSGCGPPSARWRSTRSGSSRQLSVGPESTTALMTAAVSTPIAAGDPARYASLAATLALLVGAICLLGRLARLGFLADLLSEPVLVGYMAGVAVIMIAGQLGKITGVPVEGDEFVDRNAILRRQGSAQLHWPTVVLARGAGDAVRC